MKRISSLVIIMAIILGLTVTCLAQKSGQEEKGMMMGKCMKSKMSMMTRRKKIALVAHDNKKADLLEWARFNRGLLSKHDLFATGTTGKMLEEELDVEITKLQSGPLGGDQQIGAHIAQGTIDFLIFFWDPLEPLPHDPDV